MFQLSDTSLFFSAEKYNRMLQVMVSRFTWRLIIFQFRFEDVKLSQAHLWLKLLQSYFL